MYELKIYRGSVCHDNGEWCKTERGNDLSFQNWREEFHAFDSSTRKSKKVVLWLALLDEST